MARRVTTCGLCGEEIIWLRMTDGEIHPINAQRIPDLFVVSGDDEKGYVGGPVGPWRIHRSHVATCRQAPIDSAHIALSSKGLPKGG